MRFQRIGSVTLVALSYALALLSDSVLADIATTSLGCIGGYIGDGYCDPDNNNEVCGYDGGDCCECTCIDADLFRCFEEGSGSFNCVDPSAPCFDDDDDMSASYSYELSMDFPDVSCIDYLVGDGDCQQQNNREECEYDGGDCCECTCDYTIPYSCDLFFDPVDCVDPNAPCVNDYVEVGTKTTVGVSANGYDTRPEQDSSNYGCQQDGCAPALTRDGISDDIKSRWSCSQEIVSDGSFCEIKFTFDSPQNVAEVQVAFPYEADGYYWLQVEFNGETARSKPANLQPWLTFNGLGVKESDVSTVTLRHDITDKHEWINILEVRFLVEP